MDVLGYGLAGRTMAGLDIGKRVHWSEPLRNLKTESQSLKLFFPMTSRCLIRCLLCLIMGVLMAAPSNGNLSFASPHETIIGIQPLNDLQGRSPHSLVPDPFRPLLTSQELEVYLGQLEGTPPPWKELSSPNMTRQSERLFQFNRHRDKVRENQLQLLQQPIAFVWTGELRRYDDEYKGFRIALGPEIIHTSWGMVRFKPRDIPDYMIATIAPSEMNDSMPEGFKAPGSGDIGILFMGTLVESESIMYAFSHDGDHEGMILPVVNITAIKYFTK